MSIQCAEIENLLFSYLDDELDEHERIDFESHLADCASCADRVDAETRFSDTMRMHLAPPPVPELLERRLLRALDAEDRQSRAQLLRSWALPGAATVAAAAALAVFVVAPGSSRNEDLVTHAAVQQHLRQPPIEVQGAAVSPWLHEHFRPSIEVPRFSSSDIRLKGARLSHLRGLDAAQLFYEVESFGRLHEVQAHIIDASNLAFRGSRRQVIDGRELWIDGQLGLSVVAYKAPDGIGYVFTSSDMDERQLVDLVGSSDLLLRVNERLRAR